uniref:Uncharacterized protein n=1 Tax=Anguilla anguilla TaxID=7936 RepID=A0A0E9TWA8_ANGAN
MVLANCPRTKATLKRSSCFQLKREYGNPECLLIQSNVPSIPDNKRMRASAECNVIARGKLTLKKHLTKSD